MPRFIPRILVALLTFGIGVAASMLWIALHPVQLPEQRAEAFYKAGALFQESLEVLDESRGCESRKLRSLVIESDGSYALSSPTEKIISAGVLDHRAIEKPAPRYPPIAKSAKVSGTVVVQVTVDETGRVESAYAVTGHPLLQSSAVAAARQARLSPTRINGHPVKIYGVLTYRFSAQ
ncbi:MAG TPA: energy transducer TonB [Pyrinomonadaceae bacterium]|jgi:TonB family protein